MLEKQNENSIQLLNRNEIKTISGAKCEKQFKCGYKYKNGKNEYTCEVKLVCK